MKKLLKSWFGIGDGSLLVILYMVFAAALVTSNVLAGKLVNTGVPWFGGEGATITFNAGTFCYALTLLISNVIAYKYGVERSKRAIIGGFLAQIVSTLLIIAMQYVPAMFPDAQTAYVTLLGQNWVFVIGSLTAFLACQLVNTYLFDKLTKKFSNKKGPAGVWNVVSNILGQLLDTVVFDSIAFGLGFGYFWKDPIGLLGMILGTWLFKVLVALVYILIFYLLTNKEDSQNGKTQQR